MLHHAISYRFMPVPLKQRVRVPWLPAGGDDHMGQGRGLNLTITIPNWCGKWVVPMSEFKDGVVGAKSKNLANLRGKLPDWIKLPPAVTVPFSSFEQVGMGGRGSKLFVVGCARGCSSQQRSVQESAHRGCRHAVVCCLCGR